MNLLFPPTKNFYNDSEQCIFFYKRYYIENENGQRDYPLYLSMCPDSIDFFFKGEIHIQDNCQPSYINKKLLSLPLKGTLKASEMLSSEIAELFYLSWPNNDNNDNNNIKINNIKYDGDVFSYSKLDVFCSNFPQKEKKGEKEEEKDIVIKFKILFLDFLFELEHGTAFEHSPSTAVIEEKLMKCVICDAIHAKAEYYYQKAEIVRNEGLAGTAQWKIFSCAEKEWLRVCMDSNVDSVIYNVPQKNNYWFNKIEDEVRNVVFFDGGDKGEPIYKTCQDFVEKRRTFNSTMNANLDLHKRFKQTAGWFLLRYDLDSSFCSLLISYAYQNNKKSRLSWLLYAFQSFYPVTRGILLGLAALFIVFSGLFFSFSLSILARWIFDIVIIISGFILIIYIIESFRVLFSTRDSVFLSKTIAFIKLFFPRLLFAVIAGWLLFINAEELLKAGLIVTPRDYMVIGAPLLGISLAFTVLKIYNKIKVLKETLIRSLQIIVIAFLFAIISGFFLTSILSKNILLSSGYFDCDGDTQTRLEAVIANKLDLMNPEKFRIISKIREKRFSALKHIYCYGPGKWRIDKKHFRIDAQDMKVDDNNRGVRFVYEYQPFSHISNFFKWRWLEDMPTLTLFPWLVLYRAFFVVFVALFLQLIFEDKAITEPL